MTPEQEALFIRRFENAIGLASGSLALDSELARFREFDSMNRLMVLAMCDHDYSVVISPADLDKCRTVGDVLKLVVPA